MLASPIIEGTIPAFYAKEDGTAIIAVPFSMSRAVKQSEVKGFKLKIRNIQGSVYSDSLSAINNSNIDYNKSIVEFTLTKEQVKNFVEGAFYKIQLAYIDNNGTVGYYSTVGVIKFTTKPNLYILNLSTGVNNYHIYGYTGVYTQEDKDATEKVYSYRFVFKDEDNNIIKDTGFLIHNNSNDVEYYESQDEFFLNLDLDSGKKYKLTYTVRTNNGLEFTSPTYKIIKKNSINSTLNAKILTSLNYENGYINISLDGERDKSNEEIAVKGSFILSRSSEKTNYQTWEEIIRFNLVSDRPSTKAWKDFAIEQGVKYKYSVQQYNNQGLHSERLLSEEIYADFEHCYLYDGERQLKIKFNPKVNSFKTDLLEAKVDTIGSKYPFIFRNGNVEYKEFPINGLISFLMDEEGLFVNNKYLFDLTEPKGDIIYSPIKPKDKKEFIENYWQYYKKDNSSGKYFQATPKDWNNETVFYKQVKIVKNQQYLSTNLTSDNITLERQFKLEVLDWLNNGKVKLFKSPNEGNYLVRLMNISLSPEDALGRMLHNFQATAYEIAPFEYNKLLEYNIVNTKSELNEIYLKYMTVPLMTRDENYVGLSSIEFIKEEKSNIYYAHGELLKFGATIENLVLTDMKPGTEIFVNDQSIIIGSTGTYIAPIEVKSLKILEKSTGSLTVSYYAQMNDVFNNISETRLQEVIGQQFIGKYENIINQIENVETNITNFYDIKFYQRPIQPAKLVIGYDVAIQEEVGPWDNNPEDNKYDYRNYYVLNENDEYIPVGPYDTYNIDDVYYQKEFFLYDYNDNLLWNKSVFNKTALEPEKLRADIFKKYLDIINPLEVYKYYADEDEVLGKKFIPIVFRHINKTAEEGSGEVTDLNNRTSSASNPMITDIREAKLYIKNQLLYQDKFGTILIPENSYIEIDKIYYIPGKIEMIYVPQYPNVKYLTKEDYEYFSEKGIQNIYLYVDSNVWIDSHNIKLEDKKYHHTGNIGKIKSLQTEMGIYCELFYQVSKIDYNISKSARLKEIKEKIDIYNKYLSKDYQLEQCYYNNKEQEYNELLKQARLDYNNAYHNYLQELGLYLKKIELEG